MNTLMRKRNPGCCLAVEKDDVPALQSQPRTQMSFRRRLLNIFGLSMGWCIMVSVMFLQLSTTTLAARDYNGPSTATLPAGIMMAAATLSMTPGSLLMQRFGRKPVLLLSGLAGVGGGVLLVIAARFRLLWLLIVGSIPLGICFAQSNNLRFAATEFAPSGLEPKALSLVVTGAVLSSVVGPEVGRHTLRALDPPYTATYCFLTGLCLLYTFLIAVLEFHALPSLVEEKASAAASRTSAAASGTAAKDAPNCKSLAATRDGSAQNDEGKPPVATAVAASPPLNGDRSMAAVSLKVPSSKGHQQHTVPAGIVAVTETRPVGSAGDSERSETAVVIIKTEGYRNQDPKQLHDGGARGPWGLGTSRELELVKAAASRSGSNGSGGSGSGDSTGGLSRRTWKSLGSMFFSWEYAVPVLTASLSYCGMAGMMTASPLVIRDASYSFDETTQVIQVHIISMFLPSLFTGDIICLISAHWTMMLGSLLLCCGTAIFFAGKQLSIFFVGNAIVGLGWNWAYVGASALVTTTYEPETKFVAQGVMDTTVLFGTGLSVVLAGTLYSRLGWASYTAVFVGGNCLMIIMDGLLLMVLYRRSRSKGRI